MSRWEYSIEKPMSHDEYYFVPRYPQHVARAFIAVDYDDRDMISEEELSIPYQKLIEEAIQSFAKRWGGLDDLSSIGFLGIRVEAICQAFCSQPSFQTLIVTKTDLDKNSSHA